MYNREEEIQAIKENIRIEDLAEELGFEKKKESYKVVRFKSNIDGSYDLVVFKNTNRFIDYGNGGKKGSVIDFYIEYAEKDYITAIKELRERLNGFGIGEVKKRKYDDFRALEREFYELVKTYISNSKNKTKYLKEMRKFIKEMKDRIIKEEFDK